ncbi:MAG: CheR family methyltransferase, partial [Candidatus Aenigmatarchaeota archaeon]
KQHDLLTDLPFKLMDIIFCRNVLIYFNQQAKNKLFEKFYHLLVYHGFLVIGKSELIFTTKGLYYFYPVDDKLHIYRKERRNRDKKVVYTGPERRKSLSWRLFLEKE